MAAHSLTAFMENLERRGRCEAVESEWLMVGSLNVASGRLAVSDALAVPYPDLYDLLVDVPSGLYAVDAKVMDYGDDARVSRLRAALSSVADYTIGDEIGETWTDSATLGMCDYQLCKAFGENETEAGLAALFEEYVFQQYPAGYVPISDATGEGIRWVESGFGDGTFPVFELVSAGERVGVEVELISPDTAYPFD